LLLDNDRYFNTEYADNISLDPLTPRTFNNWFHNLSLDQTRRDRFLSIVKEISLFKASGDAHFQENEKNSPIHDNLRFEFGKIANTIEVYLSNSNSQVFPLSNFGTGIQQILYILAKIAERKPKIILIEEIELNLSPTYQFELIQHFNHTIIGEKPEERKAFQLFFTTHNPALCIYDHFIVYKITINGNGESSALKTGKEERDKIKQFYPKDVIDNLVAGK